MIGETMNLEDLTQDLARKRAENPDAFCRCAVKGSTYDNSMCRLHPIGHYHRPGCCGEDEKKHTHMSGEEFNSEFPVLFDEKVRVGDHYYRVDARRFWDGAGVTITQLFDGESDSGLALDLPGDAAGPVAELLKRCADAIRS